MPRFIVKREYVTTMNPSREEFPAGFELRRALTKVMPARLVVTRLQFVHTFAVE
jgi:hypothetical protein